MRAADARSKPASGTAAAKGAVQPTGQGGGGQPVCAAPAKLAAAGAAATPPQRFDWIEQHNAQQGETIKAVRSASKAEAAQLPRGSRSESPDALLWSDDKAASIIDTNVRSPNVKIQLLTRALEESSFKVQTMARDRAAVADGLLQLCTVAGMGAAAAQGWEQATGAAPEGLQQRMDLLGVQVQVLQEQLRCRSEALEEAQAAHEAVAARLVGQQQELDTQEEQLAEYRHRVHMQEQAQQGLQLKLGLLEGQLAAESSSARRRMEEQLDTFRGEAETARTLRGRVADTAQELDLAQRMRRDEAERAAQLAGQVERLRVQVKETNDKAAKLSRQLLDKTAACAELDTRCHDAAEENNALAAANRSLAAALADHKARALLADSLQQRLAVEGEAAQLMQVALQDEISRLQEDLRAERERCVAVQADLTDEQLVSQSLRASLQAREDEIASLLLRLDEYSSRVVTTTDAVRAAEQQTAAAEERSRQAGGLAEWQRHEIATLQASLAELAASELAARQEHQGAEQRLGQAAAELGALKQRYGEVAAQLEDRQQEAGRLQETLTRQQQQLVELGEVEHQCLQQQAEIASLADRLQHESSCCAQLQQDLAGLTSANQQLETDLFKLNILSSRHRQQASELGAKLQTTAAELKAAQAEARQLKQVAEHTKQAHEAELAALEGVHAARKHRNEDLERGNKQQALIVASLEKGKASLAARFTAEQGRAEALWRCAVAHGQAYGRLAGHAAELQEQFRRQLAGLLHLCRHTALQLEAADPVRVLESEQALHPPAMRAVLAALDSLRVELSIAVALLEAQVSGPESKALGEVPGEVATGLERDLAGLPSSQLLQQPAGGTARAAAEGQPPSAASSASPGAATASPMAAPVHVAGAAALSPGGPAEATAQVALMEGRLEALMLSNAETRSKAAAMEALHQQEQGARRRAQDLAATLTADLTCVQGQLAALRDERRELDRRCRDLSGQLRDAIYTISQMNAQQQGQALSWALRGLHSTGVQTQYCELWVRNLGSSGDGADSIGVVAAQGEQHGASLVPHQQPEEVAAASGAKGGSSSSEARPLPLPDLQRLIAAIYRSKAVCDIAVARGQRAFQTLPEFTDSYVGQQHGADTQAGQRRREQLQLGVEAWAGSVAEVALFGLSTGMLAEGADGQLLSTRGGRAAGGGGSGAAVPLVMYHGKQPQPAGAAQADALAGLHRFCHSQWHAAYLASHVRQLPAPFSPADALHGICAEVAALVAGVPGAEVLLRWVATGGVGSSWSQLDLGLPLGENQVPQIYLLAMEAARLLGISTTPRIHVLTSNEAAAYYLQVPAGGCHFHGLGGSLANNGSSGGRSSGSTIGSAGGTGGVQWECAMVLTSRLIDLLDPGELQAVMAGCLGLHAALEPEPPGGSSGGGSSQPSTQSAGSEQHQQQQQRVLALCRTLAAVQTLSSLAILGPEVLLRQLPPQGVPLFFSRLQPVLLRARRYLGFCSDRASLAVAGELCVAAAALVKLACGSLVLRDELAVDAVMEQARALGEAAGAALPRLLRAEDDAVRAASSASLTVLRINQLLKAEQQARRGAAVQPWGLLPPRPA